MALPFAPPTSDVLDGPPPSPQGMAGGGPTGGAGFSANALAGPGGMPSTAMPQEVLTGVLASAEKIGQLLDSYAQIAPDLAPKFLIIKDQLQTVLAELVTAGAGPVAPASAGSQFPAAFDTGIRGPGA